MGGQTATGISGSAGGLMATSTSGTVIGGHTATSISAAGRLGSSASASISTGGHTATSGSAGGQIATSTSGAATSMSKTGGHTATSGSTSGGQTATSGSGTAGGEMATSGSGAFGSSITISCLTTGATGSGATGSGTAGGAMATTGSGAFGGSGFDLIGSGIGAGEGGCAAFFGLCSMIFPGAATGPESCCRFENKAPILCSYVFRDVFSREFIVYLQHLGS